MSGDEKLRRLREWIRSNVSYPLPNSPAGQLSIESVLFKIDRLLAEPEPVKPADTERCKTHPNAGWWTCSRGTDGCTLAHSYEPLPELVARLCGYVGPDGRGRP